MMQRNLTMRRHILLENSLYSYFSFRPFFREKKFQKRWDQKTSSQRPNCNCNLATKKLSGVSNPILKKKCFIIYIYWRSALIYQLSSEFPFSDDGSSFGTHRLKCTQGQGLRQDFKTPGATTNNIFGNFVNNPIIFSKLPKTPGAIALAPPLMQPLYRVLA